MSTQSEEHAAVEIARAHLPALAVSEIESLAADLQRAQEVNDQLYALNCLLAAELEKKRDEVARLKAQLKHEVAAIVTDYRHWL